MSTSGPKTVEGVGSASNQPARKDGRLTDETPPADSDLQNLSHGQLVRLVESLRQQRQTESDVNREAERGHADRAAADGRSLKRSEDRFHALARNVPALFCYIGLDLRFEFVNRLCEQFFKRPACEIQGQSVQRLLGEANFQRLRPHLEAAFQGQRDEYEVLLTMPDGTTRVMHTICEPDLASKDHPQGVVCLLTDITGRQQDATQLSLLAKAVANLGEGVMITSDHLESPGPQIIFVNEAMCQITGYEADELIGRTPAILQGEQTDNSAREAMHKALAGNESYRGEVVNYRKDGRPYEAELLITPILDARGERTHFVSIHRDVTESRQAQRALMASGGRLRAILNTAADAIITIDRCGRITGTNPATEKMFGYSEAELLGQNVNLILPSPYREEHDQHLHGDQRAGGRRLMDRAGEVTAQRKDGTLFPVDLAVSEVHGAGEYSGIIRDRSKRRKLKHRLAEIRADERLHLAQDIHDGLGGQMTGIGALAKSLQLLLEREKSPHAHTVAELVQYIRDAHQALRQVAHGLRPVDVGPEGLRHALQKLASRINHSTPVRCDFHSPTPVAMPDPDTATQLYRICEEAVSNAVRHAEPQQITIGLEENEHHTMIWVCDDGRGFQQIADSDEGIGLHTMQYRALQVGAVLSVEPAQRRGTIVRCVLRREME